MKIYITPHDNGIVFTRMDDDDGNPLVGQPFAIDTDAYAAATLLKFAVKILGHPEPPIIKNKLKKVGKDMPIN